MCRQSERQRERNHYERRKALKLAQREAVLSGRSVRSVIESEVDPEPTSCAKLTCIRTMPRVNSHYDTLDHDDIYRRLNETPMSLGTEPKCKPPRIPRSPEITVPMAAASAAASSSSQTKMGIPISNKSVYIYDVKDTATTATESML